MCTFGKFKLILGSEETVPPTLNVTLKSFTTFVRPLFGFTRSEKKSAEDPVLAPVWSVLVELLVFFSLV